MTVNRHDSGEPTTPNTHALMESVGTKLRTLRKERKLTLDALARRSSVSIGLISQIERGRGNPSFNTLVQLAHALEVPVARLLHTEDDVTPVVRAHERRSLHVDESSPVEAIHELLTPNLDGAIEAVWVEVPPGYDTSDTPFAHTGEEFGLVLSGRHEVYLDGVKYELGPGDSITYASTIPHWYRNPGPEAVKAVWVIHPPTF